MKGAGGPASGLGQTFPGLFVVESVPQGVRCHRSEVVWRSMAGPDWGVSWGLKISGLSSHPRVRISPAVWGTLLTAPLTCETPENFVWETLCWAWLGRDRLRAEECPHTADPQKIPAAAGPGLVPSLSSW